MTVFKSLLGASVASVVAATTALAGEGARKVELTPGRGQSFDVGEKRAVSYFLARDGVCSLTLLLADAYSDEGDVLPGAATRMSVTVAPGQPARIDTAGGTSLGFTCGSNAASMTVTPMTQVAWTRN